MKGPVAKAGSILYRFKINGINVPKRPAYKKTEIKATPIVSDRRGSFSVNRQKTKAINEQITPFTNATSSSLINFLAIVSISRELLARDVQLLRKIVLQHSPHCQD